MWEHIGSDAVGAADSRTALDPNSAPEVLAEIAQRRPELRVFVAMNPSAYPGLVHWLAQLGDPAVDAAIASRTPVAVEPPAVPPPPPPPPPPVTPVVPSAVEPMAVAPGIGGDVSRSEGERSLPDQVARVPAGRPRHRRRLTAAVLVGVLVLAGAGFAGYKMLTRAARGPVSKGDCDDHHPGPHCGSGAGWARAHGVCDRRKR